jgi:hypothetical protein
MNEAWSYINGYTLHWLPLLNGPEPYDIPAGRTVPVQFTLTDAFGNPVLDSSVVIQVIDEAGNVVIGPVRIANTPGAGIVIQGKYKYHYDLQTKNLTSGLYLIQVFYASLYAGQPAQYQIRILK